MSTATDVIEETLAELDAARGIDASNDSEDFLKPWAGTPAPSGYLLTANGVTTGTDNEGFLTSRPCWVSAVSRDPKAANWGRLVHWIDLDGNEHKETIPAELFHTQGNELAKRLASRGLSITPAREKKLIQYLAAFQPKARVISATATGWQGESFVLPSRTLNQAGDERIVLQIIGGGSEEAIAPAGSFDEWRGLVADLPPIARFLVCAALAAPLRYQLSVEAGGFHLCGATSTGKSTALQAAASVWGCGVDPGIAGGQAAYIQRWNATANALEALAAGFNDLPLIVDEIGEGDNREFGRTVYRIMSGSGRSRSKRDGSLAQRRAWRVLLISAGELPVDQYIAEGGGKARGGQLVRLVDLPVDTVFPDAKSANLIKHGCAEHYGHAGPAFIEALAQDIEEVRTNWQAFDLEAIGSAPTAETERARKRFALAAYAGQLAARVGILPWTEVDVLEAARSAYALWQHQRKATDEGLRGIENVRAFIEANAARFEVDSDNPPRDRAGWKRNNLWHFTNEGFREACNGANERSSKQALKAAGLLRLSHGLNYEISVEGAKVRVVSVRADILSHMDSVEDIGGIGDTGGKPHEHVGSGCPPSENQLGDAGGGAQLLSSSIPTAPRTICNMVAAESPVNKGSSPLSPLSPLSPQGNRELDSGLDTEEYEL